MVAVSTAKKVHMPRTECALTDSLMRPADAQPVLSVVIPTWNRPDELSVAVSSIAGQIKGALQGKVEIIVTDNASGPATAAVLKRLGEVYPSVNYMIHAENEGGAFQVYAAPHRARGRWTWVFGDDDALADDGLDPIVSCLEDTAPSFLTVNRQVWDKTLTSRLSATKHDLPDLEFGSFVALLEKFGFDQISFLSSQIYETAAARQIDPQPYLDCGCDYGQMAYYLEAFHDKPAAYLSSAVVKHRWDASAAAVHASNFHHLATYLPDILRFAAEQAKLPDDLFERIAGNRSLIGASERQVTFVDNVLENLWRCVATGASISPREWEVLHRLSGHWRPERGEQLSTVQQAYTSISEAIGHFQNLLVQIQQMEAAGHSLEANIIEARKAAMEMSKTYHP